MANDLNEAWGWIRKLVSRVSRLESGSMLENSSITNGRMRFIGGLLRIDTGGRVEIDGTLEGDGTLDWTGPATFDGDVKITKTLDVTAATTLRNTLAVKGPATLENDLTVKEAGKITVEGPIPMVLDDAKLKFSSGGTLKGYSGGVVLLANETSGAAIQLTGSDIILAGTITNPGITAKTGVTANVHIDSAGRLWKVG